jgi:hypothetical protein
MIGDSNPSMGVSPPDAGDSDLFVIRFYDTDDPDNSKDDPTVERRYDLTEDELSKFTAAMDDRLDLPIDASNPTVAALLVERETLYEILDGVTER